MYFIPLFFRHKRFILSNELGILSVQLLLCLCVFVLLLSFLQSEIKKMTTLQTLDMNVE